MRTIYLVRHGTPDFPAGEPFCLGNTDVPLGDAGKRQAALLRAYFADKNLEGIYNSTLRRAKETALLISPDAKTTAGMHELGMGEWDGLSFEEIRARYPALWAQRGEDPEQYLPPRAEPLSVCARRAYISLFGLLSRTQGDIAVVTHAGVIRTLCCKLAGASYKECLKSPVPYGSVTILQEENGELSVSEKAFIPCREQNEGEASAQ